jgi:hypothetical protein
MAFKPLPCNDRGDCLTGGSRRFPRQTISSPMDFVGLNVYFPTYVRAAENELGYKLVEPNESYPSMLSKWLLVGPESIYWTPKLAADHLFRRVLWRGRPQSL